MKEPWQLLLKKSSHSLLENEKFVHLQRDNITKRDKMTHQANNFSFGFFYYFYFSNEVKRAVACHGCMKIE